MYLSASGRPPVPAEARGLVEKLRKSGFSRHREAQPAARYDFVMNRSRMTRTAAVSTPLPG